MNTLSHEFTKIAPKNKAELTRQFEFHFNAYVKWNRCTLEEKDFLKFLVKSKWGILWLLEDIYKWKFDFENTCELWLNDVRKFLEDISEVGQEMYNRCSFEEKMYYKAHGWDSMICFWGKNYFQNQNVTTQDIVRLETFFRMYLVDKFIKHTAETQEQVNHQFESYLLANMIRDQLLLYAIYAKHILQVPEAKDLTQYLLLIIKFANDIKQEKAEKFLSGIESMDLKEKSDTWVKWLLALIQEVLPNIYTTETTKYKVQSILLGEFNEKDSSASSFRLIPEDNFYFRKNEEVVWENDIFPKSGNMVMSYDDRLEGRKDICIFNPDGHKVYWWDIWLEDIKKINWTYYILTQSEWWRDAPKFAQWNITSLAPVKDPIFEKHRELNPIRASIQIPNDVPYLIPEYVRALAVWKIEKWEYMKNPRKIDL